VPYDGSEPALAALRVAIALGQGGAAISVVTIVDDTPIVSQSATTEMVYDPRPLMEAFDDEAQALLDDAAAQCRAAAVEPALATVHERPVPGILATADAGQHDLIVMGTHARTGVARTFLGSTTEGVLRSSVIPVLTVRTVDRIAEAPFASALLAIDDSEPADAAAAVAARLARVSGTRIIAFHAIEPSEIPADAVAIVNGALARAGLPESTPVVIAQGDPAHTLIATAKDREAALIVTGTHGRRGLHRLALGSVAENIVRTSEVPVLVVSTSGSSSSVRSSHASPPV